MASAVTQQPLTMFIIVRRDLIKELNWPLGAVMAQACHSCTKALWTFRQHPATEEYTYDLDRMHKVTLEVKNGQQLDRLAEQLNECGVDFVQWHEQPDDIRTALCTRPYRRTDTVRSSYTVEMVHEANGTDRGTPTTIGQLFRKCQLFK